MPGDPMGDRIDPESLIKVKPVDDWLVNPVTALSFDGELIGPAGRLAGHRSCRRRTSAVGRRWAARFR